LPAAAGISGMQVKDYLTALVDENKIRVEKIGSGNWYWCFRGDEKRQKEVELEKWKAVGLLFSLAFVVCDICFLIVLITS